MARLNDTEALVSMGTGRQQLQGLDRGLSSANPDDGEACLRSEGYKPPMRNTCSGKETLHAATTYMNKQLGAVKLPAGHCR
jgi:hypothetical protein